MFSFSSHNSLAPVIHFNDWAALIEFVELFQAIKLEYKIAQLFLSLTQGHEVS